MAWIYALEQESEASPSSDADCPERSATSSVTPTASDSSCSGCRTDGCNTPCSGMTLKLSPGDRGVDEWISSLEASRVNLGASRDNNEGQLTSAIFGPIQGESFARYDPDLSCWKTYQACLPMFETEWEEYSESFPKTGMMRNGQLYRLQTLAHPTSASESGLWPTPAVQEPGWKHRTPLDKDGNHPEHPNQRFYDAETGRVMQKGLTQVVRMWPTPATRDHHAQGAGMNTKARSASLATVVQKGPTPRAANPGSRTTSKGGKVLAQEVETAEGVRQPNGRLWPTPNTAPARPCEGNVRMLRAKVKAGEMTEEEATAMLNGKSPFEAQGKIPMESWPTPRVSMAHGPPQKEIEAGNPKCRIETAVAIVENAPTGKLNPLFVEWLMGFPIGWTDSKPLAMPGFRKWPCMWHIE